MADEPEPRAELTQLAGGLRSLLEALLDSGATELPAGERIAGRTRAASPDREPDRDRERERERRPMPVQPEHAPASSAAPPRVVPALRPAASPAPSPASSPAPITRGPARVATSASPAALDPIARNVRLEVISREVASCTRCVLHATRTQTVFSRGSSSAELMFIGEGPGADEDAQGVPFVGKAGQLLDKMIVAMGYAPADVYVANIVKCRPPSNRKPEPQEMEACEGYLHQQIALVQPKAIVALGATAVEGLLKVSGITKLRGTWRLYRGEIPVMPTFHPAYLLRNPPAKREVWADLQQVMSRLGKQPKG